MSEKPELSAALKLEIVDQLSREELVKIVLTQQKLIEKLQQELEKLKERQPSNSKTSSKPPSSDLIQKSELAKVDIAFLRKMRYDVTDLNEVKNIEPENVLPL
jgi:uncharacterized coiled-coil protein SlyX